MNLRSESYLLQLSDEIILMILVNLSTYDLFQISRTCQRLKRLSRDKTLSICLINPPNNYTSLKTLFTKFIGPHTKEISILSSTYPNKGSRSSIRTLDIVNLSPVYSSSLGDKSSLALTHLTLIRQKLDGRLLKNVKFLPSTLQTLNLCGSYISYVTEMDQWFKGIGEHLPHLKELNLSRCQWVTSHALLAISKCNQLINLNFEGCSHVGDSIPYSSLACSFGFKSLKILNMNNTPLVGAYSSFCKIPTLEEFYFGKYSMLKPSERIYHYDITYNQIQDRLKVIDISFSLWPPDAEYTLKEFILGYPNLEKLIAYSLDSLIPMIDILNEIQVQRPHFILKYGTFNRYKFLS